jgi:hypothetical protein
MPTLRDLLTTSSPDVAKEAIALVTFLSMVGLLTNLSSRHVLLGFFFGVCIAVSRRS